MTVRLSAAACQPEVVMIASLPRTVARILPLSAFLLITAPIADPGAAPCAEEIDFACSVRCQAELGSAFLDAGDIWVFSDCTSYANGVVDCVYRKSPSTSLPW